MTFIVIDVWGDSESSEKSKEALCDKCSVSDSNLKAIGNQNLCTSCYRDLAGKILPYITPQLEIVKD